MSALPKALPKALKDMSIKILDDKKFVTSLPCNTSIFFYTAKPGRKHVSIAVAAAACSDKDNKDNKSKKEVDDSKDYIGLKIIELSFCVQVKDSNMKELKIEKNDDDDDNCYADNDYPNDSDKDVKEAKIKSAINIGQLDFVYNQKTGQLKSGTYSFHRRLCSNGLFNLKSEYDFQDNHGSLSDYTFKQEKIVTLLHDSDRDRLWICRDISIQQDLIESILQKELHKNVKLDLSKYKGYNNVHTLNVYGIRPRDPNWETKMYTVPWHSRIVSAKDRDYELEVFIRSGIITEAAAKRLFNMLTSVTIDDLKTVKHYNRCIELCNLWSLVF